MYGVASKTAAWMQRPASSHPSSLAQRIVPSQPEADHPDAVGTPLDRDPQPLQGLRHQLPVAVDDDDPLAAGGDGAGVARRVDPPVALVDDHPQPRILVSLQGGNGAVGGGVVDDHDLEIATALR